MITNGEWSGIWIRADLDYFKPLYRYFPGRSEEYFSHETGTEQNRYLWGPTPGRLVSPP
jgi:hypothetical protein